MSQQLFNHYADIASLEKEKQQVLGIFGEIRKGLMDLSTLGFKIDSAKGMAELNTATKQLSETQDRLIAANKKLEESEKRHADELRRLSQATKENTQASTAQTNAYKDQSGQLDKNIAKQVELRNRLKEVKGSLKELSQFSNVAKDSKEFADQVNRLTAEEAQLKVELASVTKFINNQTKESLAAEGSLDQLRAQLNQMLQAFDALSEAEKDSAGGQNLKKQINEWTQIIYAQESATKRFQRNVGNYQGSAKIIVDALEEIRAKMDRMNQSGGQSSPEFENLRVQAEALSRVVDNPKFLNIAAKVGDANAEVRFFTKQLEVLRDAGQQDSAIFIQIRDRLADLTDQVTDTRQEIKALSSDTRSFDLFSGAVSGLASAAQTVIGSMELFGGANDDVQRSIQRLVAIQNVANGVREIGNQLTQKGTALNKVYAFVQKQVAVFSNEAATGTQKFGAALKLTGVGLAITAIGYLISKLGDLGGASNDAQRAIDSLNESLETQASNLNLAAGEIEFRNKLAIDAAKQRGATEEEINNLTIDGFKKVSASYDSAALRQAETTSALLKRVSKEVKGALPSEAPILDVVTATQLLNKITKFKVSDAFYELNEGAQKYVELLETSTKGTLNLFEKAKGSERSGILAATGFYAKQIDDERKKREDASKKYYENERKAIYELAKYRLEQAASDQDVFKNSDANIDIRTNAARKEMEIRKALVDLTLAYELKQENITATQAVLLREKAANEIAAIESKAATEVIAIRQGSRQADKDEAQAEYDRLNEEAQARVDAEIAAAQKAHEKVSSINRTDEQIDIQQAADKFNKGLSSKEQYEAELLAIQVKYQRLQLQADIDFYTSQVALLKSNGQDTTEMEEALAKARADMSQLGFDKQKENTEAQIALNKQLAESYYQTGMAIATAFSDLIGGSYERQKNRIQEQIDLIDKYKEADINRINESSDSEEKKAARIKIIEAKAQADREALERKQKQLDIRKAQFERVFKGFQITSDTIKSVAGLRVAASEAYAKTLVAMGGFPAGVPFATAASASILAQIPLAVASGAASLVSLLATPIPKYYTGADYAQQGLGLVGDRGRELVFDRSTGSSKLYTEPTYTYFKGTEKIFPNNVTENIIHAYQNDRLSWVNTTSDKQATIKADPYTKEVVDILKKIDRKPPITIINQNNIESSAYYRQQMKY